MSDDTDWPDSKFLGFGSASTTDRRQPTKAERAEIAQKRPIGFVHFDKPDHNPPPNRSTKIRKSR